MIDENRTTLLLSLFICFFFCNLLESQTYNDFQFINLHKSDGIPNNKINDVVKDQFGFVWIATSNGLCRYDAPNKFKIYSTKKNTNPNGLKSNNIKVLIMDSKKQLWIGTRNGGLTCFNQEKNTWKTYINDPQDNNSISNDEVLSIIEDRQGRIWVGTEKGLNVYNPVDQKFTRFSPKKNNNKIQTKAILSLLEDDNGWIWAGTWAGGLYLIIPPANKNLNESIFKQFAINKDKESQNIWCLHQDSKKRYWIGTFGSGLYLMNLPELITNQPMNQNWQPTFQLIPYKKSSNGNNSRNAVTSLHEDIDGNLWVATTHGLFTASIKDIDFSEQEEHKKTLPNFNAYKLDSKNEYSIPNDDVSSIYEDKQGLIWIGTFSGLSMYSKYSNQFENIEITDYLKIKPFGKNLYIDKNKVAWFGNNENGIYHYDFKNHKNSPFKHNHLLPDKYTSVIYSDEVNVYIGTKEGISVYNPETEKFNHLTIPKWLKQAVQNFSVRNMYKDQSGLLWLGTETGLYTLDEKTGIYRGYTHIPDNPTSLSDNSISDITGDSKGNIWISTYGGLNKVLEQKNGNIKFQQFRKESSEIPSNRLTILKEINEVLYIGSTHGILSYDLNTHKFESCNDNANNHYITGLEATKDGHIWATSTDGLLFLDAKTREFNLFEKPDGLSDINFLHDSSDQDEDGYLYFGNRRGIIRFHPKNIIFNKEIPPVFITEKNIINAEGEVVHNTIRDKEITLQHNDIYLSLNFTALNYNRPEKNQYAYFLEGFEENWKYANSASSVVYTNLSPGNYTFHVKAANNNGVWNEEGASLSVIKKPAFWQTSFFKFGTLIFMCLLIYFNFLNYNKKVHKRNIALKEYNENLNKEIAERKKVEFFLQEEERKLYESNTELARSNKELEQFAYIASHDLQEPLRTMSSFIGLLKHQYIDKLDETAIEYINFAVDGAQKMSSQINSIMTYSRLGRRGMEFKKTNLDKLIEEKVLYLSQIINEKKAAIKIAPLPTIFCESYQIGMVFHNLINNALKFNKSEKPIVKVTAHQNDSEDFWLFSVADNGIGVAPKYQGKIFEIFRRLHNKKTYSGTGIGLSICQKIIELHKGKIWIESEEGKGATFFFTISKNIEQNSADNQEHSNSLSESVTL